MWLLVGVKTSPGCQAAESGDEYDMNPSFGLVFWGDGNSKEKESLGLSDEGDS